MRKNLKLKVITYLTAVLVYSIEYRFKGTLHLWENGYWDLDQLISESPMFILLFSLILALIYFIEVLFNWLQTEDRQVFFIRAVVITCLIIKFLFFIYYI